MIKEIKLTNVKGQSGKFAIAPITIITGENGVGKSALLDAITIDLVGYLPNLGKQNKQTQLLASGKTMQIASVHDGFTRTQTWASKYECKVTNDAEFVQPEMVSLVEYNKLSSADRTKYLLRRCGGNTTPAEIRAEVLTEMSSRGFDAKRLEEAFQFPNDEKLGSVEFIDLVSKIAATRWSEKRSELNGAQAATNEVTSQASEGTITEIPRDRSMEIAAAKAEAKVAQDYYLKASTAHATKSATLSGMKEAGRKLRAECVAIEERMKKAPSCSKCGKPNDCAHCAAGAVVDATELHQKTEEVAKALQEYTTFAGEVATLASAKEAAKSAVDPHLEKIAKLEHAQALYQASLGAERAADKAHQKVESLKGIVETLAAFKDVVAELALNVLERSIGGVLAVANEIINPILGFNLEYKAGEFGYTTPQRTFAVMATLSQSQEMSVCAGIQYALSQGYKERILLIDELGRMTSKVKARLIETVKGLIDAGKLHQFVAVDPQIANDGLSSWLAANKDTLDDELAAELTKVAASAFSYPDYVTIIKIK